MVVAIDDRFRVGFSQGLAARASSLRHAREGVQPTTRRRRRVTKRP
jgi:hypothetical protein